MLTMGLTLLAAIISLNIFGSYMVSGLKATSVDIYTSIGTYEVTAQNVQVLMVKTLGAILMLLAPVVISIMATGVLSHIVQDEGRFEMQLGRITFDFAKLNFISGFKRIFNKDSMVEMLKSVLKILVIAWIAYNVLKDELQNITILAEADVNGIMEYTGHVAFRIISHTCGIIMILAILDFGYIKWRYIEKLMMTKQEVKDEHKEQEGNPEVKGKMKRLQFQAAKRRLVKIIPTADVVITNPTHYAVAIKYDRNRMAAPLVIAKGADEMALAIKDLAREYKVTLVENRPLARELFEQVPENQEIPETLYAAVAEVLAYVYRMKGIM